MANANCGATQTGTALRSTAWLTSSNAPSSSSDAPANALDGLLTTRFSTDEPQAAGLYFQVNLGSAQTFNELEMDVPNSPNDFARAYNVEVSNKGTAWTTVATCTGTSASEIVSFSAQTAQYVKVVLTSGAPYNWWWSIDELNLFHS